MAKKFAAPIIEKARKKNQVVAFDGYTTVDWTVFLNLLARECAAAGIEFESVDANAECFKSGKEIDAMIDPMLIWDKKIAPTLLYGRRRHRRSRKRFLRSGKEPERLSPCLATEC